MNRKTKEQWHAELQQNFMRIVNKMIESNCELPEEFELFYKLEETLDRYGSHIIIEPYLTKEKAVEACPKHEKWEKWKENRDECIVYQSSSPGKYGNNTTFKVIDSTTQDFDGNHGARKRVACCDIEGW